MKTSAFALTVILSLVSTAAFGAQQSAPGSEGVLIKNVVANSAADQIGLQAGDRILAIDGMPTADAFDMAWAIGSHQPGALLNIQVLRGGKSIAIEGMLGRRTNAAGPTVARPAAVRREIATPVYHYTPADINDQRAYGG